MSEAWDHIYVDSGFGPAFMWTYDARMYAANPHLVPEFSHLGK